MKKIKYTILAICLVISLSSYNIFASSGNLTVSMFSTQLFGGSAPGDSVQFQIWYTYTGDGPATNVVLTDTLPSGISLLAVIPEANTNVNNILKWNLGTLESNGYGIIQVIGKINDNVPLGTQLVNSASITGSVSENALEDNYASLIILVQAAQPDLWVFHWGLMESIDNGSFLTAEVDVPVDFEIFYCNFSSTNATGVLVRDSLPDGVEYVSANPAPSSVSGNILTWNIGDLGQFGYGKITVKLKPTTVGNKVVTASASANETDMYPLNNSGSFSFTVVTVMQPIILKPVVKYSGNSDPLIMASNPKFSGLAKAGSKVTLYDGDSIGCWGDLSQCNVREIGSAIAGADRRWEITPTSMTEGRTYHLYVQAEFNGDKSAPYFNMWQPINLSINTIFDSAGFDMDHFEVQTGDQKVFPGAFGGKSGTTPYEDIVITKRFKAPPSILTDTSMWANHVMKLVITESGQTYETTLPLSEVRPITNNKVQPNSNSIKKITDYVQYDFIYVQKGFGPGAKVEVWCRPVYYNDAGEVQLAGLVFVKCHEILIDPAGYVYDTDIAGQTYEWPEVPPENSLIKNATITAMVRTGDSNWERWKAEETGQVNPQVTDNSDADRINIPGYFAFYVPSGQYQVQASAPDYADYVSPILTVVDEPVFHNVGMKKISMQVTGIGVKDKIKSTLPSFFSLDQNYPNPFNPVTLIGFTLPEPSKVSLKIYNSLGEEIATLLKDDFRASGHHILQFDASSLSSGVYFYRLTAGKYSLTKKAVLLK